MVVLRISLAGMLLLNNSNYLFNKPKITLIILVFLDYIMGLSVKADLFIYIRHSIFLYLFERLEQISNHIKMMESTFGKGEC